MSTSCRTVRADRSDLLDSDLTDQAPSRPTQTALRRKRFGVSATPGLSPYDPIAGPIVHIDDDIVAINKPAGVPTHSPDGGTSPGAVELLADQLNQDLGVHHRLDAATSGVLVFSRTPRGAAWLAREFEKRTVQKRYTAIVVGHPRAGKLRDKLVHERAFTRVDANGKEATTRISDVTFIGPYAALEARPITGRTHQIRAQLAHRGYPILGDQRYGGGRGPGGMCLHAAEIKLSTPTGELVISAPPPLHFPDDTLFGDDEFDIPIYTAIAYEIARSHPHLARPEHRREAIRLGTPSDTGLPNLKLDRYGSWLIARLYPPPAPAGRNSSMPARNTRPAGLWTQGALQRLGRALLEESGLSIRGVHLKVHQPHSESRRLGHLQDQTLAGEDIPDSFEVREHQLSYQIRVRDKLGVGLYLDHAATREWILRHPPSAILPVVSDDPDAPLPSHPHSEALNLFAYTGSFSVAAARAGAGRVTTVDLSKAALAICKENLQRNGVETDNHRFFSDDALQALARAHRRQEQYGLIVCDPPSFARRGRNTFQVQRDTPELLQLCLQVLAPSGWLVYSVNHRDFDLADLVGMARKAADKLHLAIAQLHAEVLEDGRGPLGVGTDLKLIRLQRGR